jgi:hypothetical protein
MRQTDRPALAPTRMRQRNTMAFTNKFWSHEEDEQLISLVRATSPPVNWTHIAEYFPTKTENQVAERWTKVLDPSLLKGSWRRAEDETIVRFVNQHGTKSWAQLSTLLPGRIGKQCRERWFNALDPSINRGPWTAEEDRLLLELHNKFGNHWTKIGGVMPTRSENSIKNRWNSTLSKRRPSPPRKPLPSITELLMGGNFLPSFKGLESLTPGELPSPPPSRIPIEEPRTPIGGAALMNLVVQQCTRKCIQ